MNNRQPIDFTKAGDEFLLVSAHYKWTIAEAEDIMRLIEQSNLKARIAAYEDVASKAGSGGRVRSYAASRASLLEAQLKEQQVKGGEK